MIAINESVGRNLLKKANNSGCTLYKHNDFYLVDQICTDQLVYSMVFFLKKRWSLFDWSASSIYAWPAIEPTHGHTIKPDKTIIKETPPLIIINNRNRRTERKGYRQEENTYSGNRNVCKVQIKKKLLIQDISRVAGTQRRKKIWQLYAQSVGTETYKLSLIIKAPTKSLHPSKWVEFWYTTATMNLDPKFWAQPWIFNTLVRVFSMYYFSQFYYIWNYILC